MRRTSIKNKLILFFLILILMVMVVVTAINLITDEFYLAQAISTVIALGAGIFFGSFFSSSLVRRLKSLSRAAEEISGGDLTREIEVVSLDEVRSLEEIFATMVEQIRSMIFDIKAVALQIKAANTTLVNLTEKMLENSQAIDTSAQAIAKGSEKQTFIVQKTTVKVEDSVKSMDNLIKRSEETMSKITEAMSKTQTGEVHAQATLKHLEEMLQEISGFTEPISTLADKVEKIKLITTVMDGIAQKTDLLSLNASIEATRAGESGRGFALVADEIRSMADSSKQSSNEISRLVEDILQDNKKVKGFIAKNQSDINKGREIIHGIVGTFSEMIAGVKEIFSEVKHMEDVTSQQVEHMRGMTQHFQELSRLANESFVATQKTTIATENQNKDVRRIATAMSGLNDLSQKMIETQQRFKLPEKTA